MKHTAIVLAAGSGRRMGSECPKQYIEIDGKPILYYCLKALEDSFFDEIIVVTRESDLEYVSEEIVGKFSFVKVKSVVAGGKERYDSVYNGLLAVTERDTYVYLQDGARPFVSKEILERAKETVIQSDACVVCVPVKDTIKEADEAGNVVGTPRRETLWAAQTPQAFKYDVIKEAYDAMRADKDASGVTDDASVVERYGKVPVKIVMGDYSNIKITTPEDMWIGRRILEER